MLKLPSSFLAVVLMANSALALQCGGFTYDPTLWTCYTNTSRNGTLCPIVAGDAYQLCGNGCYSNHTYSCIQGTQDVLPPPPDSYSLTASLLNSPIDGQPIQAMDKIFAIGIPQPATYCPAQGSTCPNITTTTLQDGELLVEVPGGQQTYIEASGAFAYTAAHSDDEADFYSTDIRAYDGSLGGALLGPGGTTWLACPLFSNVTTGWQVFASLPGTTPASEYISPGPCIPFVILVNNIASPTSSVWEYT